MSVMVLVCDEQMIVRAGLRGILEPEADIEVIGEAENGDQALKAVWRLRPDVVVVGTGTGMLDGVQTTWQLAGPRVEHPTPVIVISTPERKCDVLQAVRAGARGFLYKDAPAPDLIHAVRVVAAGGALLAPVATRCLLDWVASRLPASITQPPAVLDGVTKRQLEVLKLLAHGYSNAQIAEELCVSEGTVRSHVHHILTKLNLHDRVQAVAFAFKHGLVSPG